MTSLSFLACSYQCLFGSPSTELNPIAYHHYASNQYWWRHFSSDRSGWSHLHHRRKKPTEQKVSPFEQRQSNPWNSAQWFLSCWQQTWQRINQSSTTGWVGRLQSLSVTTPPTEFFPRKIRTVWEKIMDSTLFTLIGRIARRNPWRNRPVPLLNSKQQCRGLLIVRAN